jgi:hypothetical protein
VFEGIFCITTKSKHVQFCKVDFEYLASVADLRLKEKKPTKNISPKPAQR